MVSGHEKAYTDGRGQRRARERERERGKKERKLVYSTAKPLILIPSPVPIVIEHIAAPLSRMLLLWRIRLVRARPST